ncbi:MAG TPA: bifunctional 3-(3-hydroxy-phenyl)propionate/3-hydroxycinnamic acid hydroxylase [Trebonia sp.]|jgi:3-(3-hydroxy-phenyl)propionate hydroxylase
MTREVTTDVLVVGAGPCGVTMANLLAVYGVRAVVIDAEPGIYEYPRAVGIDDESLRTFQSAGIVGRLLEDITQNTPIRYYTSWGRLMAHVEPSVRPFGWPRRNNFLQPLFEAALREHVASSQTLELWTGALLTGFEQDGDGVTAEIETSGGAGAGGGPVSGSVPDGSLADGAETVHLRAKYLVGTDGGRSTVRKIAGIGMTGSTAPSKWLVVDTVNDELDAPYSAVYCDPERPVLMVPLPYGHRRWEFKLSDADDEETLTDPERVLAELIAPRYGTTPPPRVLRSAVYLHHSRTAERFRAGRVFLAGDAAHLQPPFFGQGMNSGIRDATNLAWKLAFVLSGSAGDGLLDTYDSERREHAATMVNFATRMGQMYSPHSLATERVRDVVFRGAQKIPGARDYILQMKYKPMPRYVNGVVVPYEGAAKDVPLGRMFPQPWVENADGARVLLDDVLGSSFALLGLHVDPASELSAEAAQWWRDLGARSVQVLAPRGAPGPEPGGRRKRPEPPGDGWRAVAEDVDGAFRDWLLRRPGDNVIVLRPDRYVAAVCPLGDLERVSAQLRQVLTG